MKIVQRTLFILIAVLVAIFSVQNLTMVEVQFLAWSLVMPRALLVVVLLGLGALLGRLLR
tara:strand:- start:655 stop:834 length:180 start_codon:yes stop_codon:yes gene_type:complete